MVRIIDNTRPMFIFFWRTETGKFIMESAGELFGNKGKNQTSEEICRARLKQGNKMTFDWHNIPLTVIDVT